MRIRAAALFVAPLLLLQGLLPVLAWASLPDPSWVPGIYDDADGDDVIALLTSGSGAAGPSPPRASAGSPNASAVPERHEAPVCRLIEPAGPGRAPPFS